MTMAISASGSRWRAADGRSHFAEIERVRESVEQADAEEQKSGRHSAEEEILQCGFGGFAALLVESGEQVERQAEEFERYEDQQQILRADQEHHGDGREEDQPQVLADVLGEPDGVAEQQGKNRQSEQRCLHQRCQRGEHQHSVRKADCR